jgi:hypothetical protein
LLGSWSWDRLDFVHLFPSVAKWLHPHGAPVAQLDRASGYEPEGREFESLRARHFSQ